MSKVLKAQIKELEKLVELKDHRIQELEKIIGQNFMFPKSSGTITIPSNWTVCEHDFPTPWPGIIPPSCRKCGQQSGCGYTITSDTAPMGGTK